MGCVGCTQEHACLHIVGGGANCGSSGLCAAKGQKSRGMGCLVQHVRVSRQAKVDEQMLML